MKNRTFGNWSVRPVAYTNGIGFEVYPKGERSLWSRKASIYPASDGKCFVVSMDRRPLDARPSEAEAIELVLSILNTGRAS